jgi:hypothetical protein
VTAPAGTASGYAPGSLAARRFPLVPRPKPPCRPLGQRLDRVAWLASQAQTAGADAPLRAAEACNLAALIASDCAMPDLARDLCWQQFDAYATAGPYDEAGAKLALQPLVNLARLRIRDGDCDSGYQLLQALYDAVRSQGQAVIDGRAVSTAVLVGPGGTQETVARWLWAVLLSDGLRALCRAGRWADALRQAQEHDGVGQRLLDGRQAAILALAADGRQEEARQLLQRTHATEPWEHAVAGCLRALTQDKARTAPADDAAELTRTYLALDQTSHVMFAARLGLIVAELIAPRDSRAAVVTNVTRIAAQSSDAYVAREILTSPARRLVPKETLTQLNGTVHQSSLGQPLTAAQSRRLTTSARSATAALAAAPSSGS